MHAKVLTVHNCSQRQLIEDFHHSLVGVQVIVPQDLIPEVEHLSHVTRFVVATEKEDIARIFQLKREEIDDDFWPIFSSVYVISHEENFGVLVAWLAQLPQHGDKIVELSVDVTNNDDFTL